MRQMRRGSSGRMWISPTFRRGHDATTLRLSSLSTAGACGGGFGAVLPFWRERARVARLAESHRWLFPHHGIRTCGCAGYVLCHANVRSFRSPRRITVRHERASGFGDDGLRWRLGRVRPRDAVLVSLYAADEDAAERGNERGDRNRDAAQRAGGQVGNNRLSVAAL